MKLTDLPLYGHLPAPEKRPYRSGQPTGDTCPECPGHVIEVSDRPGDVRFRCTRCRWSA